MVGDALFQAKRAGRQPDSGATVDGLFSQYVPVAGWDVSTTETNLGYIRRAIKPALVAPSSRRQVVTRTA